MLRRLFKGRNRLHHADAEVRRAAVQELDLNAAPGLDDELKRLLHEDPDERVRLACLERINDARVVEGLLDHERLGEAAARRLLTLAPDRAEAHPRLAQTLLLNLEPAEAARRLESIDDTETLVALALKARGELRDHILAHPALNRGPALTTLEKKSRDRNKTLNRHARRQLETLKALLHDAESTEQRARELAAALERHGPNIADRAWRERQHQLHAQLEAALDAHQGLRESLQEFDAAPAPLDSLRVDAASLAPLTPEPEPDLAPAAAATENTVAPPAEDDPFQPLVEAFQALDQALEEGRPFTELATERQAITERWLTAADHQPPSEAQHQVFERVSHRYRELADAMERLETAGLPTLPDTPLPRELPHKAPERETYWRAVEERRQLVKEMDRVHRQVDWPAWARTAPTLAQLLDAARTLETELERADELLRGELDALETQVTKLTQAIDEGHLHDAQVLLNNARSHYDALPHGTARGAGKRLGKQAARLSELKDWQTFATTPKREALVDTIEALAASPLAPPDQAERIKSLRREWRDLGPVTQAVDGQLADRFNRAAEKAFEPCRAYFAEQAQERQANLEARQRICDQLEQYLADTDWRQADMKAAEKIMRAARDEWRAYHPVDREQGRPVEQRFEALQGRLHDAVKAEWDRNLQAKEDIVTAARALADSDAPVQEKVATAKSLQQRWRDVGITPRRPDQRLWREFRAACDAVFSARERAREQADAELAELEHQAKQLLDEFASSLDSSSPADADEAALRDFRDRAGAIDRLPAARRRPLADRRDELITRYRALLAERRRDQARGHLDLIRQWDEAMAAVEAGRAEVPATAPVADQVVRQRRSAEGGEPLDALRRLAIQAELAAGLESPPDDEPLRLEVQVERLRAGLSGESAGEDPLALADTWCALGPKGDGVAPLRQRFFAALGTMI